VLTPHSVGDLWFAEAICT